MQKLQVKNIYISGKEKDKEKLKQILVQYIKKQKA